MKQISLATMGFELVTKRTRKGNYAKLLKKSVDKIALVAIKHVA